MADKKQSQLKVLLSKKAQYLKRINNLFELTEKLDDKKAVEYFLKRYETFEKTKNLFFSTLDMINMLQLELDSNYEPNYELFDEVDELIGSIEFTKKSLDAEKMHSLAGVSHRSFNIKLPKLELSSFSGDVKEWPVFYENFRKMIHENENLSDAERIQYLVGKLSGRALVTIAGIPPTGNNYTIIWKALVDKYDDKRKLSLSYLHQMFNFRPIQSESVNQLELFLDRFVSAYEALKALNIPNLTDFIILFLASTKLDPETFRSFEMSEGVRGKDFPNFSELVQFIKEQTKILDRVKRNISTSSFNKQNKSTSQAFFTQSKGCFPKVSPKQSCSFCKQDQHQLYCCKLFLSKTPEERHKFIKDEKRCFNCLSIRHQFHECKSLNTCKNCSQRHHSLLHLGNQKEESSSGVTFCNVLEKRSSSVLLSTAVVKVNDDNGVSRTMRVLLDSASQPNLITLKCCRALGLKGEKVYSSVRGMGGSSAKIWGKTMVTFFSHFNPNVSYTLEFLVVDHIANKVPTVQIDINCLPPQLKHICLADPHFYIPNEIDAIIGAEIYASLLKPHRITDSVSSCTAIETSLGYVIMGRAPALQSPPLENIFCCFKEEPLETLVAKFWDLEDIPHEKSLSEEDQMCENIFVKSHSRDKQGRYEVELPFKISPAVLGDSYEMAVRRFLFLEKRFQKCPDFYQNYALEIRKLIDNNYLTLSSGKNGYFIPHHAVLKPGSTSTPLRIVFDASAKTTSGYSLNDTLYVGTKLQSDLSSILLRFRLFSVAMSADVRQMYLQILVKPEHCQFQKILWRFKNEDSLKIYHLTRVTFGMSSSPFLAQRTIHQLVEDEIQNFPNAAHCIPSDMYVDDLVTSVPNFQYGVELFKDSFKLLKTGGFDLIKWSTNDFQLLQHIPEIMRKSSSVSFNSSHQKILGLIWDPAHDEFAFVGQPLNTKCTKRSILSTLARVFDPLGFLGPVLFYIKCLIKDLWELKLDWDDVPPDSVVKKWQLLGQQLPSLFLSSRIPRYVGVQEKSDVWLIGFCDGSKRGYGAVVYLRTQIGNNVLCNIFCSKSRVAPLKDQFTIPRSELCGALLLARLLRFTRISIESRIKIKKIIALTDSTITYNRIKSCNSKVDVFVKNRILKIHEEIPKESWFHVSTTDNAADCLSRGLLPQQLSEHPLWWRGPKWLIQDISSWPITSTTEIQPEVLSSYLVVQPQNSENSLLLLAHRCSKWKRLLNSIVFVLRFTRKLKSRKEPISISDLECAEKSLILAIQKKHFADEVLRINKGKRCKPEIQKLQPFLADQLLRVGGRLKLSDLDYDQRHPILLPKNEHAVELLVKHYHEKFLHAGPLLLLSLIRQKFWILGGRSVVRKVLRKCVVCFRINPKPIYPEMGDLPACRVRPSTPFSHTGVDYGGPFLVTPRRSRGQRSQKAYLCLFICLATKAVHLELAPDLSTSSFLNALRRFLARRGSCKILYSDQGTNFVGAKRALEELHNFLNSDNFKSDFQRELTDNRILWKFNPPSAPHFGGIWESNIKSVKNHLIKIIGTQILSYDEFQTVLAQIEALLNSRPLTLLSDDPSELACLTPSHFLVGKPLQSLPSLQVTHLEENKLSRPQLLDALVQRFWKRWRLEYLHSLQNRLKWDATAPSIEVGNIVLIIDENAPPLCWSLGRITEIYPGKDGITRVAQVKTNKGTYVRPLVKLCPFPNQ